MGTVICKSGAKRVSGRGHLRGFPGIPVRPAVIFEIVNFGQSGCRRKSVFLIPGMEG